MKKIEKILFSRIETWVVLLCIPVFVIVLIVFGAMVRNVAKKEDSFGLAGRIAYRLASLPADVKDLLTYEDPHSISADMSLRRSELAAENAQRRFADRSGFSFTASADSESRPDYLLLSRYNGDQKANSVELINLASQQPVFSWPLEEARFRTETFDNPFVMFPNRDDRTLLARHPFAEADGSLVFHAGYTPLYSIDPCGAIEWRNAEFAFHHSLEPDLDGNYWIPGVRTTQLDTFDGKLKDDHIVKVSATGEVLYSKSVTEILIENDLINRMYTYDRYMVDPIHLNDIEPVTEDTDTWQVGDVFLSLGHLNMVLLFRPATDEVLWWSQDRIMHQHDIDIVGTDSVSVYNNNRVTRADGDMVIGLNELVLYNVQLNTHTTHFDQAFDDHNIQTINQGLHDFSADGGVMVDETNYGRVLMFNQDGSLRWEFINRASDGKIYTTNWVRLMPTELGSSVDAAVQSSSCRPGGGGASAGQ